jgi:four helix bundle protein
MLDYERLDVYRAAIQFTEMAFRFLDVLPKGNASLADQLKRAAISIPLIIAEATGRAASDRAHYHRIARGSAMECGAIVDVLRLMRVAPESELDRAKELLVRVVSMLSRMC